MKKILVMVTMIGLLAVHHTTWAANGSISKEYHGMWGAQGCSEAKYYMHIEDSGMQMYAADKKMQLGNWDVRNVKKKGNGIIIDVDETNSHKPTHIELSKLSNGHLTFSLKIGGNGGTDELVGC